MCDLLSTGVLKRNRWVQGHSPPKTPQGIITMWAVLQSLPLPTIKHHDEALNKRTSFTP